MKKSTITVAGALMSGMLMFVLFVGFTTEKLASTNDNSIEASQLNDNVLAEAIIFDGKCGDDKDAEKKEKSATKEVNKEEKEVAKDEAKCGGEKSLKKEVKEGEKIEKKDAKESDGKGEGKCGEGKCGEGKCG